MFHSCLGLGPAIDKKIPSHNVASGEKIEVVHRFFHLGDMFMPVHCEVATIANCRKARGRLK